MITDADIEQAQTALDELTRQKTEAERLAAESRPKAERSASKYLTTAAGELDASRARVATATATALTALAEVADAATAHNALVVGHSAALAGRGLTLDDGADHETGGARDGVRIRGQWWLTVDAGTLLAHAAYRVAEGRFGQAHRLVSHLKYFGGQRLLAERPDGLLTTTTEPDAEQAPEPLTMTAA